jgi:hypothetical protein
MISAIFFLLCQNVGKQSKGISSSFPRPLGAPPPPPPPPYREGTNRYKYEIVLLQ